MSDNRFALPVTAPVSSEDSDVESGYVAMDDDGERVLPKKPVWMAMTQATCFRFNKKYGFDPIVRSGAPHPHPHSAYERNILELKALKALRKECPVGRLVDVGSAAARVQSRDRDMHAMTPLLQPGDKMRSQGVLGAHCTHKLQDCTCGPFVGALFTHSSYYIPPNDQLRFHKNLSSRVSYQVFHEFDSPFGSMCEGETKYYFDGRLVVSKTIGNAHTYTHPLPISQLSTPSDAEGWLCCDLVEKLGDTSLYRVEYVFGQCPYVDTTVGLKESLNSMKGEFRILDQRGEISGPVLHDLEYDSLNSYGPLILAEGRRSVSVAISKSVLSRVVAKLIGRRRDAALWSNAQHITRNMYATVEGVPPHVYSKMVLVTAAVAMVALVEEESNLLYTMNSRFDKLFKLHSTLLGFAPLRVLPWKFVSFLCVVLFFVGLTVYLAYPQLNHVAGWLVMSLSVFTLLVTVCLVMVGRYKARTAGEGWREVLTSSNGEITSVGGSVISPVDSFSLPGSIKVTKPKRCNVLTYIDKRKVDPKSLQDSSLVSRIVHVGVAVDKHIPRVFVPNLEAEMSGVNNRMFVETPPVDGNALHLFQKWHTDNDQMFRFIHRPVIVTREDVSSWASKYNKSRADELMKCYDELEGRSFLTDKEKEVTAFVKIEKKVDVGLMGVEKEGTPRMVCSHSDSVLVTLAPFIGKMYRHAKELFTNQDRLYFAPGESAEAVGEFFMNSASRCSNPLFWCLDAERFDAHVKPDVNAEFTRICLFKGGDRMIEEALDTGHKVVTPHGYVAIVPDEERDLNSGSPKTNLQGSLITLGIVDSAPHITKLPGGAVSCGDDGAGCHDVPLDDEEAFKNLLTEHAFRLGFRENVIVSRNIWDIDFCSKLVWPISDEFWVLGGKPGRMISRIGWIVIGPNEPNLRGMVIGLLNDNYFVPVLGTLLVKLLHLTRSEKAKFAKKSWDSFRTSRRYEMTETTLQFFYERYDSSREEYEDCIAAILSIDSLPCVINHPLIDRMIKRDE
jgi:hypothetical protein